MTLACTCQGLEPVLKQAMQRSEGVSGTASGGASRCCTPANSSKLLSCRHQPLAGKCACWHLARCLPKPLVSPNSFGIVWWYGGRCFILRNKCWVASNVIFLQMRHWKRRLDVGLNLKCMHVYLIAGFVCLIEPNAIKLYMQNVCSSSLTCAI